MRFSASGVITLSFGASFLLLRRFSTDWGCFLMYINPLAVIAWEATHEPDE